MAASNGALFRVKLGMKQVFIDAHRDFSHI